MASERTEVSLSRTLRVPDPLRVSRCRRSPELGPRILFFSGGGALSKTCRRLKDLTHNSVHLVTPFDSGGSSATLRDAFDMISIGDLRSRMLALADETARANPFVYEFFRFRFPADGNEPAHRQRLGKIAEGDHALMTALPRPMSHFFRGSLRALLRDLPADFPLSGASLGNLAIAGAYQFHQTDIDSVMMMFARVMGVLGTVLPSHRQSAHLAARLADGTEVIGQHLLTGKEHPPITSRIVSLRLVDSLEHGNTVTLAADTSTQSEIADADLICYPIGSFYSSVIANLLPQGIGQTIATAGCPKIYIPNTGRDPEQVDMSVADCVDELLRYALPEGHPPKHVLQTVLLDLDEKQYPGGIGRERIEAHGIQVVRLPLSSAEESGLDPKRLAEALVSLA